MLCIHRRDFMNFEFSFILIGFVQIFAFFIQGCTGFGCTVIAAPVVTGFLGPAEGVPYGTIISLPFLYYLALKSIREVAWKDLLKILILCTPGILLGNYLFYKISTDAAKIGIGAMVSVIAIMNIYKYIIKPLVLKKEDTIADEPDTTTKKVFRYGCLILGGIVHGAFNIGGPLITVYTLEAVKEKEKFRNTMTWLWVVLNTVNAYTQFSNGAWSVHMWSALAVGIPMAAIGFFFGMKFLKRINREQFLRIVYVVLLIIGGDMLIRSLMAVL